MKRKQRIEPYLYLLPALVFFLVFKYWPMLFGFFLSLSKWNFISSIKWVGINNYIDMFGRELFVNAVRNTAIYTAILLPAYIVIPLLLALAILRVRNRRLASLYKPVIFMPTILSFAITCMVWMWVFNPSFGALNTVLSYFGIKPIYWLSDDKIALWSIILVSGWKTFGYNMIIFIAGLSAISEELLEASVIDGANAWETFWRVKWPMLSPTTFFILVTSIIYATDKAFIPINVLTRGGPHDATTNLAHAIYVFGFEMFNSGIANAVSMLTFLMFLVITYLLMKVVGERIYYEV
jgi:sn-glycerol 3-phosphate transport system permease protein